MSNTLNCPKCGCELISEEYRSHDCPEHFKTVRTIGIDFSCEPTTDKNGDEVTLMKGINDVMYRMVKCDHKIPHNLPYHSKIETEKATYNNTDNNNRFGNTTEVRLVSKKIIKAIKVRFTHKIPLKKKQFYFQVLKNTVKLKID